MFGLSPGKILFTVVVIVAVLAVFKFMGRMSEGASGSARPKAAPKSNAKTKPARKAEADKAAEGIEDMVQCSVCGSYVAAGSARNCGRDNCPYS